MRERAREDRCQGHSLTAVFSVGGKMSSPLLFIESDRQLQSGKESSNRKLCRSAGSIAVVSNCNSKKGDAIT
jgi:hypothetical protein